MISNDEGLQDGTAWATNAIKLGYAASTSNFALSASQTTPTQITGLTSTVTIPAGGRSVRITAFCGAVQPVAGVAVLSIWDSTVNSGTQLEAINSSATNQGVTVSAIVTPSAGSKTYNVGISNSGLNNVILGMTATQPGYILVEYI